MSNDRSQLTRRELLTQTSTGFGSGPATPEAIDVMIKTVGDTMGVKASGGVRTSEDAVRMSEAGANRLGASASIAIATGKSTGKTSGY